MLNATPQRPPFKLIINVLTFPVSSNPLGSIAIDARHLSNLSVEHILRLQKHSSYGISDPAYAVRKVDESDATKRVKQHYEITMLPGRIRAHGAHHIWKTSLKCFRSLPVLKCQSPHCHSGSLLHCARLTVHSLCHSFYLDTAGVGNRRTQKLVATMPQPFMPRNPDLIHSNISKLSTDNPYGCIK